MPRRPTCPACRTTLIPIAFGMPGPGLIGAYERGEVRLGGCCLPLYGPQGWCPTCETERGFTCPVCGYGRLFDAPWDEQRRSSARPCPCCGTRFGVDTTEPWDQDAHRRLRQRWIDAGCPWSSADRKPPQRWNPQRQLQTAEER